MATQGTTGQTVVAGWTFAASGVNNGGTAIGIGNTGVTPLSNDLAIATIADDYGTAIGSTVVSNDGTGAATTDRAGVTTSKGAGTLAFNPNLRSKRDDRSETWIIRGVTTKINDVANTALLSRGRIGDGAYDNIHSTIQASSGSFSNSAHSYNVLARPSTNITPNFTPEAGGQSHLLQNTTDTTVAVSGEIFPSRSVPGELTYHFGGLGKPTTDEYKAKDSNE